MDKFSVSLVLLLLVTTGLIIGGDMAYVKYLSNGKRYDANIKAMKTQEQDYLD